MELLVILLSVVIVLLIGAFFNYSYNQKEKIKTAKDLGAAEFFEAILQGGYQKRVNDFKEYNKLTSEGGIVFVGDSLTENYNVYEYFKGYQVYNRGIGGDTTVGLLNRMDESIYQLKPSVVVLLIGINDFELVKDSSKETIFNNISLIISKIKENCPNTKIILESLYPVHKKENSKVDINCVIRKDNAKIREVNELIKTIEGVSYLDVNSHICDSDGDLLIDYTMEGLHINTYGYHFITKIIKEELMKVRGK